MSEFVINNSINVSKWNQIITFLVSRIKIAWKWAKKGTLKIQKSQIAILVLKQSPNSTVLSIVRYPGCAKTVLSGDPLYPLSRLYFHLSCSYITNWIALQNCKIAILNCKGVIYHIKISQWFLTILSNPH